MTRKIEFDAMAVVTASEHIIIYIYMHINRSISLADLSTACITEVT